METTEGMEQSVFESEHALILVRPNRGSPPGDEYGSPKDKEDQMGE
jgi:hypothetical protein